MNKKFTYLAVALVILLVSSFGNITSTEFEWSTLSDELIGFILVLAGFFLVGPWIEQLIRKIDLRFTWGDNPVKRFLIDLSGVSILAVISTIVLILSTWTFFEIAGVPESMDGRNQKPSREMMRPPLPSVDIERPEPPPSGMAHIRPNAPVPMPLGIKNINFREAYKYHLGMFLGSFLLFMVVFLFEESAMFSRRKEEARFGAMQLAQDQMLSKINALKGQINPHFMFNNLNTLSGLIHEDVDRADRFINALSKNLRYVLEQNKEIVVTLDKEIEFIKSYIHLQEERFGHKLKININVEEDQMDYQLPALTLELLIENALKHNIVSTAKPLIIDVSVDGDFLVVKNNYQPKSDGVVSTGIGLNNLKEQLELLGLNGSTFGTVGDNYIARVAMIKMPSTDLTMDTLN